MLPHEAQSDAAQIAPANEKKATIPFKKVEIIDVLMAISSFVIPAHIATTAVATIIMPLLKAVAAHPQKRLP